MSGPAHLDMGPPMGTSQNNIPELAPGDENGAARVLHWAKGASATVLAMLPDNVAVSARQVPGDPNMAKNMSVIISAALLVLSVIGPILLVDFGGPDYGSASGLGRIANIQQFLLSAAALILQVEHPEILGAREHVLVQARGLGTPLGLAVLHAILGAIAYGQVSFFYEVFGLLSFAACALYVLVWHARRVAGDDTGLIAGGYAPHELNESSRNADPVYPGF